MLKLPIRCVLFDCDGTLIDNIPLHRKINSRLVKKTGITDGTGWFPDHPTHVFLDLGWSKEKILTFWKSFYDQEALANPRAVSGAEELLEHLRTKKIGSVVVTNRHYHTGFSELLKSAGLDITNIDLLINYFHPVTAIQGAGVRPLNFLLAKYPKPDPRILDSVDFFLKKLPDYPESVLMVGDSAKIDYGLAKNCGFQFIGVESGSDTREDLLKVVHGQFIIKNVGELINML
ncbi:MAG: HAD family hydrolase [Patescibacteria group bacterium]